MDEKESPYTLLKSFSGLIHRQPVFETNRLDVDSYHLTFLDKEGQHLNNDLEVPDFVASLPDILPEFSTRQKAILTIPESWHEALMQNQNADVNLTLDINGNASTALKNPAFSYAGRAAHDSDSSTQTLLIDLDQFKPHALLEHLSDWRAHHEVLCATNVNVFEQYDFCKANELDLMQGNFYTLPQPQAKQKTSPSAQTLMELLVKLQDPDVEPEDLANTLNMDVTLSYKLLRLINSAFFGLPREVSSIKQAIVMLGISKVKTWASMLCLAGMDDKPNELRSVAMTRARMCELLAKYYKGQPEAFFAAGLFSTLDALMDKPLDKIVSDLPLSADIMNALIERTGPAGNALTDVLNYEQGQWQHVEGSALPPELLVRAYLDSLQWSKELNLQLTD